MNVTCPGLIPITTYGFLSDYGAEPWVNPENCLMCVPPWKGNMISFQYSFQKVLWEHSSWWKYIHSVSIAFFLNLCFSDKTCAETRFSKPKICTNCLLPKTLLILLLNNNSSGLWCHLFEITTCGWLSSIVKSLLLLLKQKLYFVQYGTN